MSKFKIPRNMDIEELVYRNEDNADQIRNMEDVISRIPETRRKRFIETIQLSEETLRVIAKKSERYSARKDAQVQEQNKKEILWKTIDKLKEQEER